MKTSKIKREEYPYASRMIYTFHSYRIIFSLRFFWQKMIDCIYEWTKKFKACAQGTIHYLLLYVIIIFISMTYFFYAAFSEYYVYAIEDRSTKECSYHNSNTSLPWMNLHILCIFNIFLMQFVVFKYLFYY